MIGVKFSLCVTPPLFEGLHIISSIMNDQMVCLQELVELKKLLPRYEPLS